MPPRKPASPAITRPCRSWPSPLPATGVSPCPVSTSRSRRSSSPISSTATATTIAKGRARAVRWSRPAMRSSLSNSAAGNPIQPPRRWSSTYCSSTRGWITIGPPATVPPRKRANSRTTTWRSGPCGGGARPARRNASRSGPTRFAAGYSRPRPGTPRTGCFDSGRCKPPARRKRTWIRPLRSCCASQRKDGGWSQTEALESDAYATGSALVVLHRAGGLATADPAYQRGIAFLLKSQLADGSWLVAFAQQALSDLLRKRLSPRQGPVHLDRRQRLGRHGPGAEPPEGRSEAGTEASHALRVWVAAFVRTRAPRTLASAATQIDTVRTRAPRTLASAATQIDTAVAGRSAVGRPAMN